MQSSEASAKLATVLCIPLTTQLDALRFPGTALVETTVENRLKRPSVALVFQLTAVDKQLMLRSLSPGMNSGSGKFNCPPSRTEDKSRGQKNRFRSLSYVYAGRQLLFLDLDFNPGADIA